MKLLRQDGDYMIGFPFDSEPIGTDEETGLPLLDRAQFAYQLQIFLTTLYRSGIMPNISANLKVMESTGMNVSINKGVAFCGGAIGIQDGVIQKAIAPADDLFNRIDTIVVRKDNGKPTRSIDIVVVTGDPSPNPKPRPLTRTDSLDNPSSIFELQLAEIRVRHGAKNITQSDIIDTRLDKKLCGVSTPYATDLTSEAVEFPGSLNILKNLTVGQTLQAKILKLLNSTSITSSKAQELTFSASDGEPDYSFLLGVVDGAWALAPLKSDRLDLGRPQRKFNTIYATTGTIQTSDRNKKKMIQPLDERYKNFFMRLMPVSFMFNDGTSGRTHIGFISQDVEQAMKDSDLTDLEFAGFCRDEIAPGEFVYSLRYDQFIALNTMMIQGLVADVEELKKRG